MLHYIPLKEYYIEILNPYDFFIGILVPNQVLLFLFLQINFFPKENNINIIKIN